MVKGKKTDLEAVVKKAKNDRIADEKKAAKDTKPLKGAISPLKEHSVEPVARTQNKRKKSKGATRNAKKKSTGKTDSRTIKKVEEKPKAGEKRDVAIPDRTRRKRGFFDWFADGGKPERED